MLRNVYLQGEMAEKFGSKFTVDCSYYGDILRCIDVNRPGFRKYILEAVDKNIGFCFETSGKSVETENDLLTPLKEGDVTIAPVPAGSKGFGKVILAIVIAYIAFQIGQPEMAVEGGTYVAGAEGTIAISQPVVTTTQASSSMAALSKAGYVVAANLAMTGIAEIMAPDPATDGGGGDENYIFNGAATNHREGDPVPLLYGELRVPGRRISANIINGKYVNNNATVDSANHVYLLNHETKEEKT